MNRQTDTTRGEQELKTIDPRKAAYNLFDAWNRRDWAYIREGLHPEYVYVGPDGAKTHGIEEGLTAGWTDHATGMPDGRIEIKKVYVDGDVAVTEFEFSGTRTGPWAGHTRHR